jgi:predicted kinase
MKSTSIHLVVFKGLPGCGKTTVSKALGQRLGWPVVSKDDFSIILDKRVAGYGTLAHDLMWMAAGSLLDQGFSVVCDTNLIASRNYAEACRVASESCAKLLVIECVCSDEAVWRHRIESRAGLPARYLSDWDAFQQYVQTVHEITNYHFESERLLVDTVEPVEQILDTIIKHLDAPG